MGTAIKLFLKIKNETKEITEGKMKKIYEK